MKVSRLKRALPRSGAVLFSALLVHASGGAAVPSIRFSDGNVLNIAGVVGMGQYATYLAVDFNDGPTSVNSTEVAYQYDSNTSVTGYQMMEDVLAAESPTFTFQSTSFSFGHEISGFQYAGTTGASGGEHYYALYTGDDDGTAGASDDAQGIDLNYSDVGIDDVATYDGSTTDGTSQFVAWIDAANYDDATLPTLPETAVPEPTVLLSGGIAGCVLLRRRRRAIA